jgi:hypothetical protein
MTATSWSGGTMLTRASPVAHRYKKFFHHRFTASPARRSQAQLQSCEYFLIDHLKFFLIASAAVRSDHFD